MGKGTPVEEMGFTPPKSGTASKVLLSHSGTLVCSCCALTCREDGCPLGCRMSVEGCC